MGTEITNDFIPVQSPSPYHPDARQISCIAVKCKFKAIAIDDEGADHVMKCHAIIHGIARDNIEERRKIFVTLPSPIGTPVK